MKTFSIIIRAKSDTFEVKADHYDSGSIYHNFYVSGNTRPVATFQSADVVGVVEKEYGDWKFS